MGGSVHDLYDARVAAGLADDPAQRAVLDRLERLRAWIAEPPARRGWFRKAPEPPRGLYLWGGVGRGKSMLMDLLLAATDGAAGVRRVHFHAFMQEVQAALHEARRTGVDDAILPVAADIARDLRLLLFDEMQIGDVADAMIVGRLFQRLFDAGVAVVATSNRPPRDLYKDGLNRQLFLPFIALIEQRMEVVHLDHPVDYRQGLAASASYFHPADAGALQRMDAIFARLTGGEPAPLVLRIKGREVEIPAFRNGVGRAAFWELCGRPLGPADYLAVADACRVLMIDGVPRLGSENYNEAKRFVTLVDALYEARTRVVMSAADIPENLYIEGEGAFEFERTASRLREMQSEAWGADRPLA